MSHPPLTMLGMGLVTSVGLGLAASCCAFRAKVSCPSESEHIDAGGDPVMVHRVALDPSSSGLRKLARMASLAIEEALQDLDRNQWAQLPLLLCVAEGDRPGRLAGLDEQLLAMISLKLKTSFASTSALVRQGRVGAAVALAKARALFGQTGAPGVLIVCADSLLSPQTLTHYERDERLLTGLNSDGFMPGEGAGALWVGDPAGRSPRLRCTGIGFGREPAPIDSGAPLRAEGLTLAIKASLLDAGLQMHELDFRITDNSGEQYYFKEASLAQSRALRQRKEVFDIWHPAECIGETGSVSGIAVIAAAGAAFAKGYAPGSRVLAHWSNDAGQRAAITLDYGA